MRKQPRAIDRDSKIQQCTDGMGVEYGQRHSAPFTTDDGGGGAVGDVRPHSACEPFHPALRASQSLPGPDPGATSHNPVGARSLPSKC